MLTIFEMKKIRSFRNMSYEEIARKSGVSISSVQKIFGSDNSNPRNSTVEKLSKAFDPKDLYYIDNDSENKQTEINDKLKNKSDNSKTGYNKKSDISNFVAENKIEYNIYGKGKRLSGDGNSIYSNSGYTYEDYKAMELPEGKRIEIIDGVIYDMATPSSTHQAILGYLLTYLSNELRKRKRKCLPFVAPFDVRLDFSDGPTTVVQPDLLVKCSDDNRVDEEGNELPWVPRFVIEVLSKASRSKDMFIKTKKYKEAGIVEYWMIDNKAKQVIKYNFAKDSIEIFGYDRKIGIDIFDGDIKIDFADMQKYLDDYADIIK